MPRQIQAREAGFGIEFRRWWEKSRMPGNFELKHTKGAYSLPFRAVEPAQVIVGNGASAGKGVLLRLVKGTIGSPDYIGQIRQPCYIVIRYPDFFCVIALDDFLRERGRSDRKSLTAERAHDISEINIHL